MNIWLHRFAVLTAVATCFLIFVGGLVTSTGSGLAVPDWPLSYGKLMPPMVGGIFYEHGHRMVATFVGLLTTILAIWLWRQEPRRWVRWLGLGALAAIILQGLLGGLTVLLLLPTPISVMHASLAQTFFCLVVSIALFTSSEWKRPQPVLQDQNRPSLRCLGIATTAIVFGQLVLGAWMRHTGSGLAIPDFPLSYGHVLPKLNAEALAEANRVRWSLDLPKVTTSQILVHFVHRLGALAVAIAVVWTTTRVFRKHRSDSKLLGVAVLLVGLLVVQLSLGAVTVWTRKAVLPTTAHVVTGALILAASLGLTLRAYRRFAVVEEATVFAPGPQHLAV